MGPGRHFGPRILRRPGLGRRPVRPRGGRGSRDPSPGRRARAAGSTRGDLPLFVARTGKPGGEGPLVSAKVYSRARRTNAEKDKKIFLPNADSSCTTSRMTSSTSQKSFWNASRHTDSISAWRPSPSFLPPSSPVSGAGPHGPRKPWPEGAPPPSGCPPAPWRLRAVWF